MLSIVLMAAAMTPDANACAGIFHEEGLLAESDTQEVILEDIGDGAVQVHYRAVYEGDSPDFGWIIPVPGVITDLDDGDLADFDDVRDVSQPIIDRFYESTSEDSSGGCGRASKGGDALNLADTGYASDRAGNGVSVLAEGFTGTYDYALLEATDASELLQWLDDNGWSVGGSEADLEAYIADGWQFAALGVAVDEAETYEDGRELPPVTLTYEGDMAFPARMARAAGAAEQRTTLYVIGDQRARITSGWSEGTLPKISGDINDDAEALYQDALRDLSADAATYAVTYSDDFDSRWLTRFDTLTPAADHTADPVLVVDAGDQKASTEIELHEGGATRRSNHRGLLLLLAPMLGLGWSLRRR